MSIGARLKHLRKLHNLSQNDLANALGLSLSAITSYETGRREPNFDAMRKIENYFHVTSAYLMGESIENDITTYEMITENTTNHLEKDFNALVKHMSTLREPEKIHTLEALSLVIRILNNKNISNANYSQYIEHLEIILSHLCACLTSSKNLIDFSNHTAQIQVELYNLFDLVSNS